MEFKRGDTFYFSAQLPEAWPTGTWSAKCQVNDFKRKIHEVEARVELDSASGRYVLYLYASGADTGLWAVGAAKFDVQFSDADWAPHWKTAPEGLTKSSITQTFTVVEDVTK